MNTYLIDVTRTHTWFNQKSNSKKRWIVLTIILSILALGLLIPLGVLLHKSKQNDIDDICLSPGCIHAAAKALSYMDTTVDPCEDFYAFSCGTFEKKSLIPEDKNLVGTFYNTADYVRDQLHDIISNDLKPNDTKPYRLMKKYYDLCMNTTAIESDGLKSVKKMLKDYGGWPLLDGSSWDEATIDWEQTMYTSSYFISISIGINYKNSTRRSIFIGEPELDLSREYLIKGLDDKLVKAYYNYMVDVAVIFGAKRTAAEKELKDTIEFHIELAKMLLPKEETRNATALYNPMTIDDLQNQYPFLNWKKYVQRELDIPYFNIFYDEVVVVSVPKYFSSLELLLKKTPKRVLSNFIMIRIVLSTIYFLTDELRDRQTEYQKILTGKSEREQRWKECTDVAAETFQLASGALYTRKYFDIEAKHHAEEMVKDILTAVKQILHNVDWVQEETRKSALDKADTIIAYIAYPKELLEEKKVEKYYEPIDESIDHYLLGVQKISVLKANYYNKKLREPVNKTEWIGHAFPTIVNAFYSATENSIKFPAAILQGIFYSNDRPQYMNYGAIGYLIGHEIMHGFDDQGRQYDKEGNLNNWWDEKSNEAFLKKTRCIIHQYGNYTVSEIDKNLNGINTQGENIADNGGIVAAYLAYTNWVKRNGPEKKLPGLPYTQQQIFWISAAQIWCVKTRKEALELQITTDYHSPAKYRVIGPFGNSQHFANDFNCPLGSGMNPISKCKVW